MDENYRLNNTPGAREAHEEIAFYENLQAEMEIKRDSVLVRKPGKPLDEQSNINTLLAQFNAIIRHCRAMVEYYQTKQIDDYFLS